jgi:hypothetical protein
MKIFTVGCLVVAGLMMGVAELRAESRLQPDFTFKRVGVPKSGGSRITVQVDPNAAPATMFAPKPEQTAAAVMTPDGAIARVP